MNDTPVTKQALSTEQAADAMSVSERTVRHLIDQGRLRHVRIGRRIVIPVSAIAEFLDRESVIA